MEMGPCARAGGELVDPVLGVLGSACESLSGLEKQGPWSSAPVVDGEDCSLPAPSAWPDANTKKRKGRW